LQKFFGEGLPGTPDVPLNGQIILDGLNAFARDFFSDTALGYSEAGLEYPDFELLVAVNIQKKQTLLSNSTATRCFGFRRRVMNVLDLA
jgi:hypothetical protein